MRLLHKEIDSEFQQQGEAGLIVWYDQNGTLASVVARSLPDGVRLLRFEGSYLVLRFQLEGQDPRFERRWVVYVPEEPPGESWLRDWELLGRRWEMDLLELLHRQAGLTITPRLVEILRQVPENAHQLVDAWEHLLDDGALTEGKVLDALLALVFGLPRWQMEEALLSFLSAEIAREQLEPRRLWSVWVERIADWTGWADVDAEDEANMRRRLEAAILLSELVSALPELANRFVGTLPVESKRSAAVALARRWRQQENLRSAYVRAAERVEREYNLSSVLTLGEGLLDVETFPLIDELWRREVVAALSEDGNNFAEKVGEIARIAERRQNLLWARRGRAEYWKPMALAARLYQECQRALREVENLTRVEELVQRYTADNGWWQLDSWALELAAKAEALSAGERTRFVSPAWRAYGEYLDRVNRHLAKLVEREGWRPTQPDFWDQFVTRRQRTVIFLADALRYDLCQRMKDLLPEGGFNLASSSLLGVLPSITEVGMAALLPEAGQGLEVAIESGRLKVSLSGEEVGSRQGRIAWLKRQMGESGEVMEFDQLERGESVREEIELLVVLYQAVDEFGTFVANLHPQGLFDMVERLARAISRLRDQYFERFLIVADHGFLFLPSGIRANRIKAPRARVCKRRFAIGGGRQGCLVRGAEEVGLRGSESFAFPVGLSAFALQGETGAFLHGGLSLQEAVIPVLDVRAVGPAEKVAAEIERVGRLTSRIALITVRVKEPRLYQQPRRVIVEIHGRESEPAEVSVERREARVRISWLTFDEQPPQEVTIRLIDADTRQTLDECFVAVELVV